MQEWGAKKSWDIGMAMTRQEVCQEAAKWHNNQPHVVPPASSRSSTANLKIAAMPDRRPSCSPDTCMLEKVRTAPPRAFTPSIKARYLAAQQSRAQKEFKKVLHPIIQAIVMSLPPRCLAIVAS